MGENIANLVESALENYQQATLSIGDAQAQEDHLRLISITKRLLEELEADNLVAAKSSALAFSRQVSDSYSAQPPEFKPLAQLIAKIKKLS